MRGIIQKPMLGDECMSDGTSIADRGNAGKWLFNEGSGNITADLSGNGNTGIFGAGAASPIWVPGKFGMCPSFGGDDYIEIDDNIFNSGTYYQMSISMWVYSTGSPPVQYDVMMSREWKPFNLQLGMVSGNDANIQFGIDTDQGRISVGTTDYSLTANKWHHVFLRYDGTTLKGFLNGVEVASVNGTGFLDVDVTKNIYIGANKGTEKFFKGKLDLPMIWMSAPFASEIAFQKREPFGDLGPRRFLPFAPVAAGGVVVPWHLFFNKVA